MNTDYEVITVLVDKLNKELIEYNGYGYAAGYLESYIRNLISTIVLSKKQIELLKGSLENHILAVQKFNTP
jgi:hypothetical protein